MIGTSTGQAYTDEMDFHLGRPVEDTPYVKLKDAEADMEIQNMLPKDEDIGGKIPKPQDVSDKLLQSPYERAQAAMDLNPQERSLYERHLNNLTSKGGVDNPDGSRSSLYVGTYGVDDKTYVLPRVRDGKILDADSAFQAAKKEGLDKYPSYDTRDKAEKRYQEMHNYMEEDTKTYLKSRDPFNTKTQSKNQDRVPQNAPFPNPAAPEQVVASKIADTEDLQLVVDKNKQFHIIDPRDGNKIMGSANSRSRARASQDRLDNAYGAYRYRVVPNPNWIPTIDPQDPEI